jgi:phenylacetate-CoA ligase
MADRILHLYHRLPSPIRFLVASLRGYQLRSWRYGPETQGLIEEALEREQWSRKQWQTWQQDRLSLILHRAATKVPYYREQWARRRRQGDQASWEYLENWPVLDKEALRKDAKAFVTDDVDVRRMFHLHTSGTTGKPLDLWWSRNTVRLWYALAEARWQLWHGVSRHDRWAILGGKLVSSAGQNRPPFWVHNIALNQLYMSSYHLSPQFIPYYLDALAHYRIRYLWGYTSSLYTLARETLRSGRRDLKMIVVIANAEPVFDYQRQAISEAFQCPVRETYGMAEIVAAAGECRAGQLHQWPDAGQVEVFQGDQRLAEGATGDFVCTGLINADMPLIRYRIGDRGRQTSTQQLCSCGRTLPVMTPIDGRIDDVLFTTDGRRVGRLDTIFKAHLPICEAQIIQERLDQIRVRYVPTPEFTRAAARSITERLQERMGDVKVILEVVGQVPREVNGKFRAVVCKLPAEERINLQKMSQ